MNFLRTILIIGIFSLIFIIAVLFVISRSSDTQVDNPDEVGIDFPNNQDIVPVPDTQTEPLVVKDFHETPEGYEVNPVPTSGLVTSVVRQDYSEEFDDVLSTVFLDVYFIDECVGPSQTERALILTAEPDTALGDRQFAAAEQAILDWEAKIPRDIGRTINPSLAQSDLDTVDARFTSYDLYTRFSTFNLGNQTHHVYYTWVLNFIVFAPSIECLTASVNGLYAPSAH